MKGIFYLTFNGVVNNTNGIGTQTKLLLDGFDFFYDKFKERYGDIFLNIITPDYPENYEGYSRDHVNFSKEKVNRLGGKIFFCKDSKTVKDFWTPEYWDDLSKEACEIIKREMVKYDDILVICVDMPFLQMPIYFENKYGKVNNIKWLLSPYGSSYIHDKNAISNKRLAWEFVGMSALRLNKNVYLGTVCDFMSNHWVEYYGAPKDKFAPYESSLFLQSKDFEKLNSKEIEDVLVQYKIPIDKDIVFCFGRGVWIKGFDMVLNALQFTKKDFHLVMISVPTQSEINEYGAYLEMLKKAKYSYTIIPKFSRILPKALCQWRKTRIVVCPSRGEPFSNIPLETAIWAKDSGPIVLASNIDGFLEQIKSGFNGYLFKIESPSDLAKNIDSVLFLKANTLKKIRNNAYNKVVKERNFFANIKDTLDYFWNHKK
ncbi:MAG: hypothetical protein A3C50_02170 [Candidatus Staskawiczbacteria bacterium RIFCSPHIGHO2_02_FULL_43_16]|uniref:Glycosyl transferase family 1 domain-containing protein n=1 Tax=Candidatus Staskawiczbacteria bacterium RIFCSPHIGHO2_01_FULL_41_41 TaxID=1802203 RepID=A0A1G2HWU2_9BACT|nr:MAG: hypothetical protein A2822_00540 [Candidatus Staskawiczbacteria bacterium RIFCSPHIGHO2_01_FULL_41_41]OGZ68483.1 MAG: hypothetical protein A3C50_02170 [Candidatus Staskawiczbacteria bacterium RIFCSPHIGHO2_02_FULL_43_16]OGZ74287.1 MAG: hypothetical protein A3A12_02605 [Candidatus Staskawiczbacteria bacterium RIFCSPLOWO2_01_FULL_43_17b]